MKRGYVAVATADFDRIDTSTFPRQSIEDGVELLRILELYSTYQETLASTAPLRGRAAVQSLDGSKLLDISPDQGIIEAEQTREKVTDTAEFMCLPGEFAVAQDTNSEFVFDLLEEATGVVFKPVTIQTQSLRDTYPDARIPGGDFQNTDGGFTGSAHSPDNNIEQSDKIGEVFEESDKTTLRILVPHNGQTIKLFVTQSGYVQVDKPATFTPQQFAGLIADVVLPHAEVRE
ncbi:hypothetical protein [Haloferax sp. ATB1]|uniref:hypothetical protein n=1 Tax=Haloferax sp. ATB1 TaxID=1508454 RepID=UPI0005B20BF8|nr:hypothetical protein [Haloferax sp. ATB1]